VKVGDKVVRLDGIYKGKTGVITDTKYSVGRTLYRVLFDGAGIHCRYKNTEISPVLGIIFPSKEFKKGDIVRNNISKAHATVLKDSDARTTKVEFLHSKAKVTMMNINMSLVKSAIPQTTIPQPTTTTFKPNDKVEHKFDGRRGRLHNISSRMTSMDCVVWESGATEWVSSDDIILVTDDEREYEREYLTDAPPLNTGCTCETKKVINFGCSCEAGKEELKKERAS